MTDQKSIIKDQKNHIFPFTGIDASETENELRIRFQKPKDSGIHSMLLLYEKGKELQRFDDTWFALVKRVAKVCRELQMTYWTQDAAPYPTGGLQKVRSLKGLLLHVFGRLAAALFLLLANS